MQEQTPGVPGIPSPVEQKTLEIETVRCIVENTNGDVLLLQKTANSKAPSLFEFPGGKIDTIASGVSALAEQTQAAIQEVKEETGIDVSPYSPQKVDAFTYTFDIKGTPYNRRVHVFHVILPTNKVEIAINQTLNAQKESEDKHQQFVWVSKSQLTALKNEGKLSGNSQRFEKALQMARRGI